MKARLFARTGPLKGVEYPFEAEATLGRDPDNGVVVPGGAVSKHHARIVYDEGKGRYLLEDLDSLNGTELDGVPVHGVEPLGHLHVITLAGGLDLLFQDLEACRRRHGPAPPPAPGPVATPLPPVAPTVDPDIPEGTQAEVESLEMPSFLAGAPVSEGTQLDFEAPALPSFLTDGSAPPVRYGLEVPLLERRIPLAPGDNIVGRATDVAVRIDVLDVSRRHAVLRVEGAKVTVRDNGSSNHTFVDEEKVEGEVTVQPGQRLCFGSVEARLVPIGEEE